MVSYSNLNAIKKCNKYIPYRNLERISWTQEGAKECKRRIIIYPQKKSLIPSPRQMDSINPNASVNVEETNLNRRLKETWPNVSSCNALFTSHYFSRSFGNDAIVLAGDCDMFPLVHNFRCEHGERCARNHYLVHWQGMEHWKRENIATFL